MIQEQHGPADSVPVPGPSQAPDDPLALAALGEPLRIRVPGELITTLPIKGRNLRGDPGDTTCLQVVRAPRLGGDVGSLWSETDGKPWADHPGSSLQIVALLCANLTVLVLGGNWWGGHLSLRSELLWAAGSDPDAHVVTGGS